MEKHKTINNLVLCPQNSKEYSWLKALIDMYRFDESEAMEHYRNMVPEEKMGNEETRILPCE